MELVELGALSDQDWAELQDGEHEPFGPVGAALAWRPALAQTTGPIGLSGFEMPVGETVARNLDAGQRGTPIASAAATKSRSTIG